MKNKLIILFALFMSGCTTIEVTVQNCKMVGKTMYSCEDIPVESKK